MAKSFIKTQSATTLADLVGITRKPLAQFFDEPELLAGANGGACFRLPGLGRLELVDCKASAARSQTTGEAVPVRAPRVVKIRIVKATKAALLRGKSK
jgi:nucleoid DNA-binding protein